VADETEDESYDLVDGFGDLGNALCDGVAILTDWRPQLSVAWKGEHT
jgi:hypothetical protein